MINLINIKQCSIKIKNDMKIEEKKTWSGWKGTGLVEGDVRGVGGRGECGGEERWFGNAWMDVGVG
jgi:hypothetical protein